VKTSFDLQGYQARSDTSRAAQSLYILLARLLKTRPRSRVVEIEPSTASRIHMSSTSKILGFIPGRPLDKTISTHITCSRPRAV